MTWMSKRGPSNNRIAHHVRDGVAECARRVDGQGVPVLNTPRTRPTGWAAYDPRHHLCTNCRKVLSFVGGGRADPLIRCGCPRCDPVPTPR